MTNIKVIVEKHSDGYVAYPLGLKGVVVGEGDTYEEALADYEKALQLRPDYADALYNMACLFSLKRKPDDAIPALEKTIGLDKKYREQAAKDSDFENIRDDPRFRKLVEG